MGPCPPALDELAHRAVRVLPEESDHVGVVGGFDDVDAARDVLDSHVDGVGMLEDGSEEGIPPAHRPPRPQTRVHLSDMPSDEGGYFGIVGRGPGLNAVRVVHDTAIDGGVSVEEGVDRRAGLGACTVPLAGSNRYEQEGLQQDNEGPHTHRIR